MNLFKSLLAVSVSAISAVAFADAAKKLDLTYTPATMELTVKAVHDTKNVAKHFIDSMEFFVDDKSIHKELFKQQSDKEFQIFTYKIMDAKPGAKIKVVTVCNKGGNKAAEMVVPDVKK